MIAVRRLLERRKYLTFVLGEKEYGFGVAHVRNILLFQPASPVPNAPHHFKGVTKMRGEVFPVVSARLKLGMPEVKATPRTCIILVSVAGSARIGTIVDRVFDIIDVDVSRVEPPRFMPEGVENGVIGVSKSGNRATILLDAEEFLANDVAYHCCLAR